MADKKFHILTEDLDIVETVSPGIFKTLEKYFFFHRIKNRRANIDYYEMRLSFRLLHHSDKRGFICLIHSVHVIACDLYKYDRFNEYMAFDCLLTNLLHML